MTCYIYSWFGRTCKDIKSFTPSMKCVFTPYSSENGLACEIKKTMLNYLQ